MTDNASLDELLVKIKSELVKLGPLIDRDATRGTRRPESIAGDGERERTGWQKLSAKK